MIDNGHKEEILAIIAEYMKGEESEIHKLKCKVAKHLAEKMTLPDLQTLAIKEVGEMVSCYAMGHTDGMLFSYVELKMVMKAIMEHLPEGMTARIYGEAVRGYADMFNVQKEE